MQPGLATHLPGTAEYRYRVTAGGSDPRAFQPRNAGADDCDATSGRGGCRLPLHLIGQRHPRIVVAHQWLMVDDLTPTGVAGNAVTDITRPPLFGLARPGGIGNERTAYHDQFRCTTAQDALGFRRIGNQGECGHGYRPRGGLELLDEFHPGGTRPVSIRDMPIEGLCVRALAKGDVVDMPLRTDPLCDLFRQLRADASRDAVITRQ